MMKWGIDYTFACISLHFCKAQACIREHNLDNLVFSFGAGLLFGYIVSNKVSVS